jgi:uncharacterized protein YyaL (SSP411 family)
MRSPIIDHSFMTSYLANEQSAYLKSAEHQPVRWHPWSAEAFRRARDENKPILLDIGAVWCHWCHVMDHESYEDPAIAEILNREFICVKVDRDERPDVDARYQRAVQALTGQGGWPLTAFLTPRGEVFYGGTYFPPDGKYGRPGFATVLEQIAQVYKGDPNKVQEQARQIAETLAKAEGESRQGALTPDVLTRATDQMARAFDFRYGGFGSQPKFPHPGAVDFILTRWYDERQPWQWEIVERTLTGMAKGGIRDHVGGGFHRYAVDAQWIVPHFEKMIYDNSELLRAYVHAAAASAVLPSSRSAGEDGSTGERELYNDVIRGVVTWVGNTMSDRPGGYFSSQDADVGPDDDGDYFTWTPDEVRAVVTEDEYDVLARRYDIDEAGEMHHNPQKNVLWIKQSMDHIASATGRDVSDVERLLAGGLEQLRAARGQRSAPFVDETVYTGWSAMMASAMLEAAAYLERDDVDRHALETLNRLWAEAADDDGAMLHATGSDVGGMLDDQVQTAAAALDAYEATGATVWLERAQSLMDHVWDRHWTDRGGLLDVARDRGGEGFLTHELVPTQDAPTPSPNGVAGIVFCRLAEHTGEAKWRDRAIQLLEALAGSAADLGLFAATLLRAIDWAVSAPAHIVIVGDDTRADALHRTARRTYRPRKVITRLRGAEAPPGLPDHVRAMVTGDTPRAYVCAGTACAEPVSGAQELAETLATFA